MGAEVATEFGTCSRGATICVKAGGSRPVEATEFPDLARRYRVTGVPKTVVNENIEILGGVPQDAFVEQALGGS